MGKVKPKPKPTPKAKLKSKAKPKPGLGPKKAVARKKPDRAMQIAKAAAEKASPSLKALMAENATIKAANARFSKRCEEMGDRLNGLRDDNAALKTGNEAVNIKMASVISDLAEILKPLDGETIQGAAKRVVECAVGRPKGLGTLNVNVENLDKVKKAMANIKIPADIKEIIEIETGISDPKISDVWPVLRSALGLPPVIEIGTKILASSGPAIALGPNGEGAVEPTKRRGRPKGSKNKPKGPEPAPAPAAAPAPEPEEGGESYE